MEFLHTTVSVLDYRGAVRTAILELKFGKKLSRAKALGILAAQGVRDHMEGEFDLISWPPLSAKRLRQRGFDQARELAGSAARELGSKATRLFDKEDRPAQSGLDDPDRRRANVLGAYRLLHPEEVRGKSVLLIDDVVTTGATLSECARVLLTAGAERVCAATVAKAGPGRGRGDPNTR